MAGRKAAPIRGVVAGIRGVVAGIRGAVAGIRGAVAGIRGVVAGIRGVVAGIRGAVAGIRGVVAGIRGMVAGIGGGVAASGGLVAFGTHLGRFVFGKLPGVCGRGKPFAGLRAEIIRWKMAPGAAAIGAVKRSTPGIPPGIRRHDRRSCWAFGAGTY